MAVSKRLRYEIFRRDNYTCRYCGASAPDVQLTVDHVIPEALGGRDAPSNLVTACADCNSGKTSIAPDAAVVDEVDRRAEEWASAMQQAATERAAQRTDRTAIDEEFMRHWNHWNAQGVTVPVGPGWNHTIHRYLDAGLTIEDILELIPAAMNGPAADTNVWKYFCGCLKRRLIEAQERAAELLDGESRPEYTDVDWSALFGDEPVTRPVVTTWTGTDVLRLTTEIADDEFYKRLRAHPCPDHEVEGCCDHLCIVTAACLALGHRVGRREEAKRQRSERRRQLKDTYRAGFDDGAASVQGVL